MPIFTTGEVPCFSIYFLVLPPQRLTATVSLTLHQLAPKVGACTGWTTALSQHRPCRTAGDNAAFASASASRVPSRLSKFTVHFHISTCRTSSTCDTVSGIAAVSPFRPAATAHDSNALSCCAFHASSPSTAASSTSSARCHSCTLVLLLRPVSRD